MSLLAHLSQAGLPGGSKKPGVWNFAKILSIYQKDIWLQNSFFHSDSHRRQPNFSSYDAVTIAQICHIALWSPLIREIRPNIQKRTETDTNEIMWTWRFFPGNTRVKSPKSFYLTLSIGQLLKYKSWLIEKWVIFYHNKKSNWKTLYYITNENIVFLWPSRVDNERDTTLTSNWSWRSIPILNLSQSDCYHIEQRFLFPGVAPLFKTAYKFCNSSFASLAGSYKIKQIRPYFD